jgi:predicted ATPase
MAYAELGQLDDAWRCIDDAIAKVERSQEKWCEAEVHRIAGEIALKSLAPGPEKAEAYFDRALAVARRQQAKSWELRAAMSMARLWRDQSKRDEARELLAPVILQVNISARFLVVTAPHAPRLTAPPACMEPF